MGTWKLEPLKIQKLKNWQFLVRQPWHRYPQFLFHCPKVAMPPILWLNINFQYILLRFLPKKLTLRAWHILSPLLEVEGIIQFWPYFFLGPPILNQLQMFPSECKIIFCGPHCTCRTETFTPTCHAHLPHPPATPTSHTHLPNTLVIGLNTVAQEGVILW